MRKLVILALMFSLTGCLQSNQWYPPTFYKFLPIYPNSAAQINASLLGMGMTAVNSMNTANERSYRGNFPIQNNVAPLCYYDGNRRICP